jgi:hypothetical protein
MIIDSEEGEELLLVGYFRIEEGITCCCLLRRIDVR